MRDLCEKLAKVISVFFIAGRAPGLVLYCLDGERVVGNDDNSVCASSDP